MSIITVVIVLLVIGLLLYAANNWLPLDPKIRQIINVVVIIAVILWLLASFFPGAWDARVPDLN